MGIRSMPSQPLDQTLHKQHTPCKNCAFAIYKDDTQVACELGVLTQYKQYSHVNIVEAFDAQKEFYIVNGIRCAFRRSHAWIQQLLDMSDTTGDMSRRELNPIILQHFDTTTQIPYIAFILFDDNMYDTIDNLIQQQHKPQYIVILKETETKLQDTAQLQNLMQILKSTGIPWRIVDIGASSNYHHEIHKLLIHTYKQFLVAIILNGPYEFQNRFIMHQICQRTAIGILPFAYITDKNLNILNTIVFRAFGGNRPRLFTTKITEVCPERRLSLAKVLCQPTIKPILV